MIMNRFDFDAAIYRWCTANVRWCTAKMNCRTRQNPSVRLEYVRQYGKHGTFLLESKMGLKDRKGQRHRARGRLRKGKHFGVFGVFAVHGEQSPSVRAVCWCTAKINCRTLAVFWRTRRVKQKDRHGKHGVLQRESN